MIMYQDLYTSILKENAIESIELKIISGYASPSFLERVLKDFPKLKISLYIGMTDEGISFNNHFKFREIQMRTDTLIFYQSNKLNGLSPTHIKVYEFSNRKTNKVFVGSANFTENGFVNNRELLVEISDSLDKLFDEQQQNSVSCLDENITDYINFTKEKNNEISIENPIEEIHIGDTNLVISKLKTGRSKALNYFGGNIDYRYLQYFSLSIALNSSTNNRWKISGINGVLDEKESVLMHSLDGYMYDLFEENAKITIYTDDGKVLNAQLIGKYNKELTLIGEDTWYDYIIDRLGIDHGIPLSNENLSQIRCSNLEFERIGELEYLMWLSN